MQNSVCTVNEICCLFYREKLINHNTNWLRKKMATEKEKYALLNGDSDLEDELKINPVLIENEKKR